MRIKDIISQEKLSSSHYFYKKCMWTRKENLNFDFWDCSNLSYHSFVEFFGSLSKGFFNANII